ncbi:hypothetical protein [Acinetobacter baumannii]|uniref:hypothetical protein n=1 Tax=Acinetobacter baumannii TaxID=470 RepID=UPI001EDA5BB5|nr:hypothetical protein [Acinetobacter baumannii]
MSNNENHQANMLNSASIIESQFSDLSIFINEAKKSVANVFTLKINNPAMLKNIEGFTFKINNISELLTENRKLITTIKESDLYKNIKVDPNLINPNFEDIKSTLNIIYMSIFAGTDYNRMLEVMVEEYINYYNADNEKRAVQYVEGYLSRLNRLEESLINLKTLIHEVTLTLNSYQFGYNDHLEKIYLERFKKETIEFTEKIEKTSNKLLSTHGFEVKKLKDDYQNILNNFNLLKENFKNSEKHNQDLQKNLINYEQRINQIIQDQSTEIKDKLETKVEELETYYSGKIKVINDSYDNATINYARFTSLVEKAGIYNLTQNYASKAKEEKDEYQTFRKYTSRALYAAVFFTIIILVIPLVEYWGANPPVDTNYFTILARLTISLIFFVLAFYFSKQAAKHYECYQENHKTFLQLAALEPFMANMSPEDQLAIRKQLIPTYFNQSADGKYAAKGDEIDISTNLHSLLSQVISVVAEKKDSKPSINETETSPSNK